MKVNNVQFPYWTLNFPWVSFTFTIPSYRDVIITDLAPLWHKGIQNLRVLVEKLCHWDLFSLQIELHIVVVLNKYWARSWLRGWCLEQKRKVRKQSS